MALSFGPLYQDFYSDLKKRREEEAVAKAQGIKLPAVQMSNQVKSRASQLPKQNAWDLIKDTLFDANTAQDKYRRSISGRPEEYGKNFGQGVTDNIVDAGKTFVSSIAETPGAIAGAAGPLLKAANDNPLERFFSRAGGKILYNKSDAQIEKRIKQQRELTDLSNQEAFKISKGMMDAPSNVEALKPTDPNSGGATAGRLAGNMIADTAVELAAPEVSPYYAALKYGGSQGTRTFAETGDANTANKAAAVTGTTQGLLAKVALANMVKPGMKVLPRVGLGAVDSGGSQLITNAVDQATWDKNRQLTEGVGLASLIGGGVGLGTAALRRGSKKPPTETTETPTKPLEVDTTKLVKVEPQPTTRPVVTGPSAAPVKPQVEAPSAPVAKVIQKTQAEAPDPIESLKQEARKYKSAEEFVKSFGELVHHGSDKKIKSIDDINLDDDTFFTLRRTANDLDELKDVSPDNYWSYDDLIRMPAKAFGGEVSDFRVKFKNPMEVNFDGKSWFDAGEDSVHRLAKEAKAKGHDGLIVRNVSEGSSASGTLGANAGEVDDYLPLTKDSIFTEKQLTDLYNQATQPQPPVVPPSTAPQPEYITTIELNGRKYDMTEEQLLSRLIDEKAVPKAQRTIAQQDRVTRLEAALKDLRSKSQPPKSTPKAEAPTVRSVDTPKPRVEAPKSIETIPVELKSSGLIQAKEIIPISKLKTSKGVVLDNELTQSIKQNGVVPLLVDKDNMIFEGQHRLKSLEAIGAKEAPIYRIDMDKFNKLSEDQKLDFLDNYNLSKTDNINIQYPKVALKGEQPRPTGFTKAGEALDMSRYKKTGQTPEQARIADIAKRTGVSEETLTREAAKRGGIDAVEGTANSLIDDTVARNKDAVFVSKLKEATKLREQMERNVDVTFVPRKEMEELTDIYDNDMVKYYDEAKDGWFVRQSDYEKGYITFPDQKSQVTETPTVKEAAKPKVESKDMLPVREDVPYDVDPVTGTYRTAADMIDNAPEAKKVSPVQAQEITGAIVNRVDEGMDAVDNILKAKGSSLEEMFRAIQTAMRNGDAFPEQYRAEYNMVKGTLDKLRDASGKKMGDIGDGYLPQFRSGDGPQVQVGKSLVELIDMEDFGFSKKRENLIPLEELDYSKEGIKKYATQAMSYKYRDALDIEAIQKRAMETDGVKLSDKEALAVRDKEVEIAKEVKEAASKPGAILKADILDKTDELAAVKKKKRIEIVDSVSFAKRELLDTDTLTRDIKVRTPEGKTKNMFEVFGFRRYRDAEGNAKQILYKSLEDGDYESIRQHIAATNLPENVQKNLLQRLGDDLRAVQSKIDELDLPESKIADATKELYEAALTSFERRIAREELTRAMETYKISNKGLRKIVNFHAQRMLTHDGYTRNMAEKATNFVTGLYYRGALGYNVSSALLNLFELQRVTSEVGMINGAKAIRKALTDWDITKRYGLHESTFENLLELKKEGVNVKKGTLSKVENYSGLMKMFEWTERIKDATLLHALEAKYADAGLSNQARVTRILADFNKLAIKGGQFGSVGLYKSKTGRTLFQFMQYPIKDLTITLNKASKAFNGDTEATKYLVRLFVQRTILYMAMNAAIGTSAEVAFGIFNPVRQSRIDEEASNAEKVVSYIPGGPSVSMLKDVYIAMQQAAREAERNDEQFDPGDVINKQVARDLTLLVPGGNQLINKSLSFKADMDRGYNQSSYKNDKGEEVNRARFAAPDNPIDIAKGYVFGPYSTKEANEYFGKKVGSDLPFIGKALEGERYSPVSKRQQERIEAGGNARELIEEERINQRAKKEFKKTNPNLWAVYEEIVKSPKNEATGKRESDVITPEKWKKIHSDDSLKLFDYIKQMAEARNKQYGDTLDPIYKLTDPKQVKAVLAIRSAYTGDDEESKDMLRARNPWYKKFEEDYIEYIKSFDKNKLPEDSEFGVSQRKQEYLDLTKQNPSIPDISKQKYPIISKYLDMEEGSEARKQFYKNNADALSAAFDQQKKDKFEWTNKMRELEGAKPLDWEAFQNVTFGYEDDEEKVAKALYFKGKSGSGYGSGRSRKVSMKNIYGYSSGLTPRKAKTQTVKKIAAPKVKVASSKTTKPKVTIKKSKV